MRTPMRRNQMGLFPSLHTFMDEFFNQGFAEISKHTYAGFPSTNVRDEEEAYTLELAVPGFQKEDFSIEVKEGKLLISSKAEENKEENGKYYRREFVQRAFSRSFQLPDHVDSKGIKANYESGILYLSLPKVEKTDNRFLIDIA